jgi:hypothetical protein
MRAPTTLLILALTAATATAATPGPECRLACAPRIEEQCGGRVGRELRRCRRPLLRACRATTPGTACPSSAELTRALGDRRLELSADTTLRLCADGRFVLGGPVNVFVPVPGPAPVEVTGSWRVIVAGDALAIDLAANVPLPRRRELRVERAVAGGFVVDGAAVSDADATSECVVAPPLPPVVDDPGDPERVLAVARAVTDRTLIVESTDAAGRPVSEQLRLCGSGAVRVATVVADVARNDAGTWTIDAAGSSIELALEDGLVAPTFVVTVLDDGRILLNDLPARVLDARGPCDDLALEERFTAGLVRSAYSSESTLGGVSVTSTLAFCDAERVAARTTFGVPTTGRFRVRATAGTVTVELRLGTIARTAALTEDDDGVVLLDGLRPVEDPALLLRFACS